MRWMNKDFMAQPAMVRQGAVWSGEPGFGLLSCGEVCLGAASRGLASYGVAGWGMLGFTYIILIEMLTAGVTFKPGRGRGRVWFGRPSLGAQSLGLVR